MGRIAWAIATALAVCGCAANVQTVARPDAPLRAAKPPSCQLPVHPADRRLGPACVEIGDVYVGDTGFTTDCGWNRALEIVRQEACRFGADAAQIVAHHEPSFWGSTCHQVRARFLVCATEPARE